MNRKNEPKKKVAFLVFVVAAVAAIVTSAMYISSTSAVPQSRYLDIPDFEQNTQPQEEAILQFVSGTEYLPGQAGQVIVEARYRNGSSAITVDGDALQIDKIQQNLYDDVSVDRTPENTSTQDLWEGKATYMDGGPYAGSALTFGKFPESYAAGNGCEWEFNGGDSRYVCGPSGHKAMQKNLTGFSDIAMGVKARLSISQPDGDGGDAALTYAHMVIADRDANRWRYTRERFQEPTTETYRGPEGGSANGLSFDTLRFNMFEIIDGESYLLASANGSDDFCNKIDSFDNGRLRCQGAVNSETAKKNFTMYVQNGRVYVEYEGDVIIDTETEYKLSENTTYGFVSHRLNNVFTTEMNVYEVEEISNATEAKEVEVVNCDASVQYPDKTYYFQSARMIRNSNGNAYYGFEVPSVEGVYEYQTVCDILGNDQTASKSFHVTDPGIGAMVVK